MKSMTPRPLTALAVSWRHLCLVTSVVLVLFTTFVTTAPAFAATPKHTSDTTTYVGTPNTYHASASVTATQVHDTKLTKPTTKAPAAASTAATAGKPFTPTMQPLHLALAVGQPTHAISSDGRFEVTVPAGALATTDVASAGGSMGLGVWQIAPGSGSTDGGIISLGTYLLQLQDSKGHEFAAGKGFQQPITLTYHYPSSHSPVALSRFKLVVNGARPVSLPVTASQFGSPQTITTTANTTTNTISAQVQPLAASTSGSFDTDSPQGWFGKADATKVGLQTGDLTYSVPLDIPQGPGGLTPPLTLSYSSNAISQTHNVQAAAPWVGQGWSLGLGEITWSESNYSSNSGTATWQNTWSLSDPFGSGGDLIPPSTCFSTYYDDTSCTQAAPPAVANWTTAPDSHIHVISYTNPTVDCTNFPVTSQCGHGSYGQQPPCFRVWLQNGIMEEFGCTTDARQWYPGSSSGTENLMSAWLLDLITDPNGNQIHIVYSQDMSSSNGVSYPRDVVMSQVAWDSPSCHNAQTMCTGGSWAPLYNVNFSHSNTVAHAYAGAPTCGPINGIRCDDPQAETSPNIGTPLITQTQVLNDATVSVHANGAWNTLRSYRFSYGQAALNPNAINDPVTGNTESVAGYLTLDQVQELGTDTSTTTGYPPYTFGYTVASQQYYEDSGHYAAADASNPAVQGECGGQWNVTGGMQTWNWGNNVNNKNQSYPTYCTLWARTYALFMMTSLDNGQGLHESFTWTDLRTNQHGVPSGYNAQDPTVCTSLEATIQGSSMPLQCRYPDDNGWSHMGLASRTEMVNTPTSANPNATQSRTWSYTYRLTALTAQECSDCTVGMYWGDANDGDYLDYYNGRFAGFAFVQVNNPDGSQEGDYFYTTEGWGLYSSSLACHDGQATCPQSRWWDTANAAGGRPYEVDDYNVPQNGSNALLKKTLTSYAVTCPATGVSSDTSYGQRAANLDPDNPIVDCDVQTSNVKTYTTNGINTPTDNTVPMSQVANSYGAYGFLTTQTTTGNDLTTTPTIVHQTDEVYNDSIQTSTMPPTGTFLVKPADDRMQDTSGNMATCSFFDYDGQGFATGSSSTLTKGLESTNEHYTNCATWGNWTGWLATTYGYNTNGDPLNADDADAIAGITSHKATTGPCTGVTRCSTYDANYGTLPATQTNDLNQTTTTNHTTTSNFGFGLWPSSTTDANGQSTTMTYDVLGRTTATTSPGETTGDTTTSLLYDDFCNPTGASAPCLEVDTTERLDASTTIIKRDFYNGWGEHVESRVPAPGGQDVVQYAMYDVMGRVSFQSQPYFVTAYTGGAGSAAYSTPDTTQKGTTTTYDGLDRTLTSIDPNSATATTSYGVVCAPAGTNNDQACYASTTTIDANHHQSLGYTDGLGRGIYDQSFTGNSTYTLYRSTQAQYDLAGDKVKSIYADGTHQSTASYDGLQRETGFTDPDLGSYTLGYDPNGNPTSSVDPRGASGSVYTGYDGLNRMVTRSTNSNGSSPFASYSYDSTASGNQGIGHLTGETFASGPSQSVIGGYTYVYDARGRQTGWTMSIGSTSYPFTNGYNDANQQTTLTYPDGDVVTTAYGAQDWLSGVTEKLGSSTKTLLNTVVYSGASGASEKPTSAQVGNGAYQWAFGYDADLRPQSTTVTLVSNGSTLFSQTRGYDAMGNVTSANTTLPAGTDNQVFCYDEQNRLVWAGASGTPNCSVSLTPGSLTAAQYNQSFSYDVLNRLTTGPLGAGYTYGDSAHLDAVTAANGYTAAYDSAGNMTCRAYNGSGQTCTTTSQHGQPLTYDATRQLLTWQSSSSTSPSTETNVYNGEGQRVQTTTLQGGGGNQPSTTTFVGTYEEVTVANSVTTTTKYYQASMTQVISVNGSFSYLVNDGLNSVDIEMGSSGNLRGQKLYGPYGNLRYSSGFFDTQHGFTGQYADSLSGLDYYNARYYDPVAGQFISADYAVGPNRYSYVSGNPETTTDPSGNCPWCIGALIGAAVGAAVSYGAQVVSNVQQHGLNASAFTHVDVGAIGKAAVAGAIIGAGGALLEGAVAGMQLGAGAVFGAKLAIGAATGAAGQMLDNAMNGKPIMNGVGMAALEGVATAGILHGIFHGGSAPDVADSGGEGGGGEGDASDNPAGDCGANSFQGNTLVATPIGEQAIDTLVVGSTVLAYDGTSGKVQAEPVQHVFINHDTNLLDVTIATSTNVKPASADLHNNKQQDTETKLHVSQAPSVSTETLHTTTEHPFLTMDRGFVDAANLVQGEQVLQLDGSVGTVVAVKVLPGEAVRYNLTVQDLHTYAVGEGQWVVHNCDSTRLGNKMGRSGRPRLPNSQAHHLIPCQCKLHPLLSGYDLDSPENGVWLRDNAPDSISDGRGLPYHSGNHPVNYTSYVNDLLDVGSADVSSGASTQSQAIAWVQQQAMTHLRTYFGAGVRVN